MRLDLLSNGTATLRHVETNETRQVTESQLVHAILDGRIIALDSKEDFRENSLRQNQSIPVHASERLNFRQETRKAIQSMEYKRLWIEALNKYGINKIENKPWVRTAMLRLSKTDCANLPVYSISTLSSAVRLANKFGGDWSHVVPKYSHRGGRGKKRIDERAEKIIDQVIAELKLSKERIVKVRICQHVRNQIRTRNLSLKNDPIAEPGDMTISRRVKEQITAFEISRRNDGEKFARKKYRNNASQRFVSDIPLLTTEYDDMDCEVFLIDEGTGMPVGRAYLTHGIDQATGMPLGFELSHKSRSFESAMGAICSSLLPKNMSESDFAECKYPWNGYGAQGTIILDNAKYNFSKATRHQAEVAKLLLAGARPYGPTEKSSIEHFNHVTKQDFCRDLPGFRGRKDDPDAVKNGLTSAIMDVKKFRQLYTKWVTDVYLNNPQIDGYTPREKWLKYFSNHSPAVRWSLNDIAMLRMKPIERSFRASGGITSQRLIYFSEELHELKKYIGAKEKVFMYKNINDLSYGYVQNPMTQKFMRVPCTTDIRYTKGLTERQQELILKIIRQKKNGHPNLSQMIEARRELIKLVAEASKSTKMKRRQQAVRTGNILDCDEGDQTPIEIKKEYVIMTSLESSLKDIADEDLDDYDEDWGEEE